MSENAPSPAVPRSPELMRPADTALLVVDMQARLMPSISDAERITWNARRLIDGAKLLGVETFATEQYPEKLGGTLDELAERIDTEIPAKLTFSCSSCDQIFRHLLDTGKHRVLICGIETHVCVQQTVLDLLAAGFQVILAADAISSRFALDRDFAFRRMEASGAVLTTTEAALFELCEVAGTDEFRAISKLVKEVFAGEG